MGFLIEMTILTEFLENIQYLHLPISTLYVIYLLNYEKKKCRFWLIFFRYLWKNRLDFIIFFKNSLFCV